MFKFNLAHLECMEIFLGTRFNFKYLSNFHEK